MCLAIKRYCFLEISEVMKTVAEIDELVKSHDVLFLLVDTREGRWLPTLLAALHSKVKIGLFLEYLDWIHR